VVREEDTEMTDARTAWADVCDRLDGLALKLRLHAEEELAEDEHPAGDGPWSRLRGAAGELGDAVEDAASDPAVRQDLRDLVSALETATTTTARQLRRTLDRACEPSDRR
jgi:hypothetical protein